MSAAAELPGNKITGRVWLGTALLLISLCALAAKPDAKLEPPLVTFVEIGSVNCIPCRMMQPVMKKAEQKYPGQVKIVFHDVWTPQGEPYGRQYKIRTIPTQVFLDKNGREFFRHEGFFDFESLEKVLKAGGVK